MFLSKKNIYDYCYIVIPLNLFKYNYLYLLKKKSTIIYMTVIKSLVSWDSQNFKQLSLESSSSLVYTTVPFVEICWGSVHGYYIWAKFRYSILCPMR
jgi:hypothetical protein